MLLWLPAVPTNVVQVTVNWGTFITKKKAESNDHEAKSEVLREAFFFPYDF